MKNLRLREIFLIGLLMIALSAGAVFIGSYQKQARLDPQVAMAAISNPSTGSPGYMMTVLPMPGSYTTGTVTNKVRFKMPWPATLIGAVTLIRTSGTANAVTIDVTEAGTTVLSAPIAAKEVTVTEGTISDSTIADEATIGVNVSVSGTGTAIDPTLQLIFKRQ